MSLFDMIKGKAAELLTGAGDKVSELTGIDLPGAEIANQLTQSATGLADAGQNLANTATGAGQNLADTATGAGQNLAEAAGTVGDAAIGAVSDATDPGPRG
jgi:hypothetical protein